MLAAFNQSNDCELLAGSSTPKMLLLLEKAVQR